jgi:hypothetical protein
MLFSLVILVSVLSVCLARLGQKESRFDTTGAPHPYDFGSTTTNVTIVTPDSSQFCTCTCYNAAAPTATPTALPLLIHRRCLLRARPLFQPRILLRTLARSQPSVPVLYQQRFPPQVQPQDRLIVPRLVRRSPLRLLLLPLQLR